MMTTRTETTAKSKTAPVAATATAAATDKTAAATRPAVRTRAVLLEGQAQSQSITLHHAVLEDFSVYRPAGFVVRWYALTLDFMLATPLDVLVRLPFARYLERLGAFGDDWRHHLLSALLTAVPLLVYFVGPTLLYGQTLGKHIVGLRVIGEDSSPRLTLQQVLLRETFGKLASALTLGVGFLMVASSSRRRALHDHLARTNVVTYRER
jgi:uncharacterized RDD family membrane protein YckC